MAAILLVGFAVSAAPSLPRAQSSDPAANQQLDPEMFIRFAHSIAVVQARAAEVAASRQTRPEVKAFAEKMVEFRRNQIHKLEGVAREGNITIPAKPEREHRLILENLEPLDFLALSRRYAEFQFQALEQELQIYARATTGQQEWPKVFAAGVTPELQRLLDEARKVKNAVGP
jgi:predicted outer membrane protein